MRGIALAIVFVAAVIALHNAENKTPAAYLMTFSLIATIICIALGY